MKNYTRYAAALSFALAFQSGALADTTAGASPNTHTNPVTESSADSSAEATTETSKNPVTGTITYEKKFKMNRKAPNGDENKEEVTETQRLKKDGSVEKELEVDSSATQQ